MNKTLLTASTSFLALVLGAAHAHAADPPRYSELPAGSLTTVPKAKAPGFVAAREKVPGIYVAMPPADKYSGLRHWQNAAQVVGDPKVAEEIRRPPTKTAPAEDTSGACFLEADGQRLNNLAFLGDQADKDFERQQLEWENISIFNDVVRVQQRSSDYPAGGVTAVHRERVIDKDGSPALESIDAWVDPTTQGARLIAKTTLPLKLVTTTLGGAKVFAARDDRPDGRHFVQFIVATEHDKDVSSLNRMWATREASSVVHGECAHLRVGLPVDAIGSQAVFTLQVRLPNETKDTAAVPSTPTKDGEPAEKEVRHRPMQVQVSLSKTSRDKEPVVSVSTTWSAREVVDRVAIRR